MKRRVTGRNISAHRKNRLGFTTCILAVTAFLLTAVVIAYAQEKINVKVNYVAKLNELARAGRPEELNAAPYYKKAFELVVERPDTLKKLDHKIWPADLSVEQKVLLQTWVQQNAKALAQLRKGTQKPYYWLSYQGNSMWDIDLAFLAKARVLTHVMSARAKLNAAKGNFREAFSDLLVCYKFGTHFGASTGPKELIEQLVAIAIRGIAIHAAFQILDKKKPPLDLLKNFQRQLQLLSSQDRFTFDFTAEKLRTYDSIQMMFKHDRPFTKAELFGLVHMFGSQGELSIEELRELRLKLEKLNRPESLELADDMYEYFGTIVRKAPYQIHSEGADVQKEIEKMTKDNPILRMVMPNAARVVEMSFRAKVESDALVTTIAILRYNSHKGQYPENIEKLVAAGYLDKLPMDPYSEKPLVYKRTRDDFMLYSIGADFDDDGVPGRWGEGEKGGDWFFWPYRMRPHKVKDEPKEQ